MDLRIPTIHDADRVVVYSPQIYENYKLKSGEGLSIPFVVIWLLGDITNLAGAALAGLLPTMILLAVWVSTQFVGHYKHLTPGIAVYLLRHGPSRTGLLLPLA